jgi:hypothetical protein
MTGEGPRWLSVEAAAVYLCMRPDVFLKAVKAGKLPAASYALGERTPRWDRDALDARMAGIGDEGNVRAAVDGLVEKIAREAQGRKSRQAKAA